MSTHWLCDTDGDEEYARLLRHEALTLDITEQISKVMHTSGVSLVDVAREIGYSVKTLSCLLDGSTAMNLRQLSDIAGVFGYRAEIRVIKD